MHRDDLLRRVLEHVRGPQRAIDVGAQILKFGSHAAVKDVNAVQNRIAALAYLN